MVCAVAASCQGAMWRRPVGHRRPESDDDPRGSSESAVRGESSESARQLAAVGGANLRPAGHPSQSSESGLRRQVLRHLDYSAMAVSSRVSARRPHHPTTSVLVSSALLLRFACAQPPQILIRAFSRSRDHRAALESNLDFGSPGGRAFRVAMCRLGCWGIVGPMCSKSRIRVVQSALMSSQAGPDPSQPGVSPLQRAVCPVGVVPAPSASA